MRIGYEQSSLASFLLRCLDVVSNIHGHRFCGELSVFVQAFATIQCLLSADLLQFGLLHTTHLTAFLVGGLEKSVIDMYIIIYY